MTLNDLGTRADKTPDYRELKRSEFSRHLVLVIDDFKRGKAAHGFMNGSLYYGKAETLTADLCLKKSGHGTGIGILLKPKKIKTKKGEYYQLKTTGQVLRNEEIGRVEGELYSLSLRHLTMMDKAQNNTVLNNRRYIWVVMQDGVNKGKTVKAWVYFANEETLDKRWPIKDLRLSNMLKRNNVNVHYL